MACPACEQPFSDAAEVEAGDSHKGIWPGPPHSTFARYARVCADPAQSQRGAASTDQPVRVYLHTLSDLRADGAAPGP